MSGIEEGGEERRGGQVLFVGRERLYVGCLESLLAEGGFVWLEAGKEARNY